MREKSPTLTGHHNVIETRSARAVLVLRTTADRAERREVLDFVEISALIVVVVMIRAAALVRLSDRIGIIILLLLLSQLILFAVRVLIRTWLKLNGIIIVFGFV